MQEWVALAVRRRRIIMLQDGQGQGAPGQVEVHPRNSVGAPSY